MVGERRPEVWQVCVADRLDSLPLQVIDPAIDIERVLHHRAPGVLGDFYPAVVEARKPVEETRRRIEREAWHRSRGKRSGRSTIGPVPKQRFAENDERYPRQTDDVGGPRAGREHESVGMHVALLGLDHDAAAPASPIQHASADLERRPGPLGGLGMGGDARLHGEIPGLSLVDDSP